MGEVVGALYGLETLLEGAVAVAKGIYDPTLPLKTTLVPLTDLNLPRSHHTVSVVKGRAYIFGGKTSSDHGNETLADNDMHIVILPSSGVESTDYRKISATQNTPPPRYGHAAVVIDDQIYVYGGSGESTGRPIEDQGAVWSFDTTSNAWSKLSPSSGSLVPDARFWHASVASEYPRPKVRAMDEGTMPQLPLDPARDDMLPEPAAANTYGTLIVFGGLPRADQKPLSDMHAFDIASRTWSTFSSPPATSEGSSSPSLAMVGSRVYAFVAGQTHYLDLVKNTFSDKSGAGDLGLSPHGPWSTIHTNPDSAKPGPGARSGAALIPVTTGQGRNYLLLLGGEAAPSGAPTSRPASTRPAQHSDIWALQLRPEGMTAASFKDAARLAIKKPTAEAEWAEVRYYDEEGVIFQEGQSGRGIGQRRGFAAARGSEVDGCSVLVWGGVDDVGKVSGNGILITVDR